MWRLAATRAAGRSLACQQAMSDPPERPTPDPPRPASPPTRSARLHLELGPPSSSLGWLRTEHEAAAPGSAAPEPPRVEDLPKDTRVGPYRICELIGRGGMGSVYRAFDIEASRLVALKLLFPHLISDPRSLARFRQEALLAEQLRDPRIVRVLAYGEDGGRAWLSMELAEGPSLEQVVEREGALHPHRAAKIVAEIARAVAVAHEGQVIHRDLKPGNVLLTRGDRPLVLDFGLAKDRQRTRPLTESGFVLGTPVYVAPEMVSSKGKPDERVDVYGVGGILFYLLTRRALYESDTPIRVIEAVMREAPPRLSAVAPHLPRDLDRICAQALAREPSDRYPSALALAEDLERFLAARAVFARPPGRLRLAARTALQRPRLTALVTIVALTLLTAPVVAVRASAGLARRQRASQALAVLAVARQHALEGRHAEAEQEFLHAMLVAKGAFLEDPRDEALLDALRAAKRARAEHAERTGHWELAQEIRTNLARLEGSAVAADPAPVFATLRVTGIEGEEVLLLRPWSPGPRAGPAHEQRLTSDGALTIEPGSYLALHLGPLGLERAYLVSVAPGTSHALGLDADLRPPQGAFILPSAADLQDPRRR